MRQLEVLSKKKYSNLGISYTYKNLIIKMYMNYFIYHNIIEYLHPCSLSGETVHIIYKNCKDCNKYHENPCYLRR